ncbi:Mediator of RNA polymerase II transcription subunit 6 [Mitosporidium daphniae]
MSKESSAPQEAKPLSSESLKRAYFYDLGFLEFYGLFPTNIMEYFSLSPFYDRSCNNEILRMQGLLVDEVPVKSGDEYPMSMKMLLDLEGIHYIATDYSQDTDHPENGNFSFPKFIVKKMLRQNKETSPVTIGSWYSLGDGIIYQSPDLGAIFNCRLSASTFYLSNSLENIREILQNQERKPSSESHILHRKSEAISLIRDIERRHLLPDPNKCPKN